MVDTHSARQSAARALELTGRLIEEIGPRPAGSRATAQCAASLDSHAESFADRTWTEQFAVNPGAFLGWIRVVVVIYAASVACLWFELAFPAAILVTIGILIMVAEFFLYCEALDPFYPRRVGTNAFAALEPVGEVRGELIVSGHHDSARVFNFLVHQPSLYSLRVYGGIGSLLLLDAASWTLALQTTLSGRTPEWSTGAAIAFTALFLLVGQLWWFASSRHTSGAGDNLASSAAAVEVLQDFARLRSRGEGLSHLRITAASSDAEEAGLRGSRAWRRARWGTNDGHLTWNLNLECLSDASDLFLLTTDINGSVELSGDLAQRCSSLLTRAGHSDVPLKPIAFLTGGTDAAETARADIESTTLMGMPWGNAERSAMYHTFAYRVDSVSQVAVAEAIRLAHDLARELDRELRDG